MDSEQKSRYYATILSARKTVVPGPRGWGLGGGGGGQPGQAHVHSDIYLMIAIHDPSISLPDDSNYLLL